MARPSTTLASYNTSGLRLPAGSLGHQNGNEICGGPSNVVVHQEWNHGSADESELAYELRVTIEFVRFGMKAIEQPAVPRDQVQRAKVSLQETLDILETARRNLRQEFPFG
jgi:hypothetical protein